MTSTNSIQNIVVDTLQVNNTLTAPSITKGEVLVNDGTVVAYPTVGTDTQLLQANSASASGIDYTDATGGTGGNDVKVTVASSTRMAGTSGILRYLVFNPWSDVDGLDSLSIPYNTTQLTYLQIFPNGSESWSYGAGATSIFINVGTINSAGAFVAAAGATPHFTLTRVPYNTTNLTFQMDVTSNSWIFNAGDNFTMSFTYNGGNGGDVARIGVLATFEGAWS